MSLNNLNIEQRFAKALLDLRQKRPFYAAIYESIDKIEDNTIQTAAVDIKNMYYNKKYMENLPYSEFLFVILHELTHIALLHVARIGNRDITAWNYCTDFIVNHIIMEEFGLKNNGRVVDGISVPHGTLIMDLTDDDTAEGLYGEFIKKSEDEQQKAYNKHLIGAGGRAKGSKQSDNSKENDGGNNPDNSNTKNTDITEEVQGNTQNSGDTVDLSNNTSDNGNNQSENNDNETNDNSTSGSLKDTRENEDGADNGELDNEKQKQGQQYAFTDLLNKRSVGDELDIEQVKGIIATANMREKMEGHYGTSGSMLGKLTAELLKSKNDWIKMLKRYCIKFNSSDTSFNSPDKRMYYQKAIYPGSYIEESNRLEGVELCIDTSGSMSETDIGYVLGQMDDICTKYKVNYETLCWDTGVAKVTEGTSIKDIIKEGLAGGGGTDPMCIFNYLTRSKKKCKVIIIFTDGYFYTDVFENAEGKKLRRKFKNVIWVMTRQYNREFKPSIGKLAFAKFPE